MFSLQLLSLIAPQGIDREFDVKLCWCEGMPVLFVALFGRVFCSSGITCVCVCLCLFDLNIHV